MAAAQGPDDATAHEVVHRPAVRAAVELAAAGAVLPAPLATAAMEELMDGAAPPTQVAALLAMLRLRGETPEELAAFARVMRSRVVPVEAPADAVDLCGTGADGTGTFNISTLAAFVVAGAGVPVAKHGNRAVTSNCGSADLIEALGIPLDPGPEAVARRIREIGFGFIFAPAYHPAMKHAMPIRRELPMRTAFNLLGPISSPAGVRRQLLGVADAGLLPLMAGALARLDTERALVVHSADGLDELSLGGPNVALLVEGRSVTEITIDPISHGLPRADRATLAGGDAQLNSAIGLSILGGEPGPARDVVLLNAGAALFVAGRAADVGEGIEIAAAAIDSGAAAELVTASAAFADA
jgi:anthranilate phosphoribosyltransferase